MSMRRDAAGQYELVRSLQTMEQVALGLTGQLVLLDPELSSVRDMLGQGGSAIDPTGHGDPAPHHPIVAHVHWIRHG